MALSSKALKALSGLSNEARTIQLTGAVLSSRQVLSCAESLREELERLIVDGDRLLEEVKQLRVQRTALQEELENCFE